MHVLPHRHLDLLYALNRPTTAEVLIKAADLDRNPPVYQEVWRHVAIWFEFDA